MNDSCAAKAVIRNQLVLSCGKQFLKQLNVVP